MKRKDRERYEELDYLRRTLKKNDELLPEKLQKEYFSLQVEYTAEMAFIRRAMEEQEENRKPIPEWRPPVKGRKWK